MLFRSEEEEARRARLEVVMRNLAAEMDDTLGGGQQGNDYGHDLALLEVAGRRLATQREAQRAAEERERAEQVRRRAEGAGDAGAGGGAGGDATGEDDEQTRLQRAFEEAAAAVREQRAQAAMCVEDKILTYFKRLCREWDSEMESRPEARATSLPLPFLRSAISSQRVL